MKRKFSKKLHSILRKEKKVEKVKKERGPEELTKVQEAFMYIWILSPIFLIFTVLFLLLFNAELKDKNIDLQGQLINIENGQEKITTEEGKEGGGETTKAN